ncbi:ATP-dependent helicase [Rhizobium ruizarguesonis]|uniref:UvrD-helicase domain-containing protein n=1 Tax=Rhizobium ruizarguesonis TaxID=2081791 RepID=UPI0010304F69|nr:UvrD-helicase domain-containing protein [Rhizobium ruizarguesonis]TAZ73773.1 ATP-dependent helicase [Rhizobium ruizarguesonis]TBA00392.1 ATP-dependent helicase [Rhizobium ruizarguesonis]
MSFQKFKVSSHPGEHPSAVERLLSSSGRNERVSPFDMADALGNYVASTRFVTLREATEWLSGILAWVTKKGDGTEVVATAVLEAMIVTGVFGVGNSFGQQVLVPLSSRSVLVPGIGRVRIGGVWQPAVEPVFPGSIFAKAGNDEEAISLLEAIGLPELTSNLVGDITHIIGRTRQGISIADCAEIWAKRLIVLISSLDATDQKWRTSTAQASSILEWIGVIPEKGIDETSDPDQVMVVRLPASKRAIVSAGPGSGKTQVVCRRIIHLLEQGTPASNIWLLSFTRVAVEELRKRIGGTISSTADASSLRVATFDSFASRVLDAGLPNGAARPNGYDAAVSAASDMLLSPSPILNNHVARISHVVIDEAQDLVGTRLSMMRRFVDLLPATCGVTILGDPAQSIYGWNISRPDGQPGLLDPVPGFESLALRTDHRTQDARLASFFSEARDFILGGAAEPDELYVGIREKVEAASVRSVQSLSDPAIPAGNRTMVLFRSRRALLSESHRLMTNGRAFRLRPSGHGQLIRPWIGALLAGLPLDVPISRGELVDRFSLAAPVLPAFSSNEEAVQSDEIGPTQIAEQAWQTLLDLADNPGHRLSLTSLYRRLGSGSLPPGLLRNVLGNTGPVLGTIHGAKGLEADHVVLMLPRMPNSFSGEERPMHGRPVDLREEARVLYVGATRAKRALYTGSQRVGKLRRMDGSRSWRGHAGDFSMEVGIEGDILPFVSKIASDSRGQVEAAMALVAPGESPKARPGVAVRDLQSGAYAIFRADSRGAAIGPALGLLSSSLLAAFAKVAGLPVSALPARIAGFFLSGAATCVWASENGEHRGIALIPVLCGFATISMEIPK